MNLDCWGCGKKAPADGPLFLSCGLCKARKLIKCNFCSDACFKANWPRHEKWHAEQEKDDKRLRETAPKVERPELRGLPAREKEYDKLLREAEKLHRAANYHAAFKVLREAIKLCPAQPGAYQSMANALMNSNDCKGAARYYLLAEEQYDSHDEYWANSIAAACNFLGMCPDAPRPCWWNDEDLLRLSAEAVAACGADDQFPLLMRACALLGCYTEGRPRTAAELRESARFFTRAAEIIEALGDTEWAKKHRQNAAIALAKMRHQLEALVAMRDLSL